MTEGTRSRNASRVAPSRGNAGKGRTEVSTRRLALVSLIVGLAVGASTGMAAADQHGQNGPYGPVGGHPYFNYSDLFTGSRFAVSDTTVDESNGAWVPTGWLGASADLDTSNGALCARSGWTYNLQGTWTYGQNVGGFCGVAWYYAIGATCSWNAVNAYDCYYTFRTANDYVS